MTMVKFVIFLCIVCVILATSVNHVSADKAFRAFLWNVFQRARAWQSAASATNLFNMPGVSLLGRPSVSAVTGQVFINPIPPARPMPLGGINPFRDLFALRPLGWFRPRGMPSLLLQRLMQQNRI